MDASAGEVDTPLAAFPAYCDVDNIADAAPEDRAPQRTRGGDHGEIAVAVRAGEGVAGTDRREEEGPALAAIGIFHLDHRADADRLSGTERTRLEGLKQREIRLRPPGALILSAGKASKLDGDAAVLAFLLRGRPFLCLVGGIEARPRRHPGRRANLLAKLGHQVPLVHAPIVKRRAGDGNFSPAARDAPEIGYPVAVELLLASESPYRRELLERLAVPYRARAHRCDETRVGTAEPPAARVALLARHKAESLADLEASCHILGSDQLVEVDGEVLGKPGSRAAAAGQLRLLQGRTHRIHTAAALRSPDGAFDEHLETHELTLRPLDDAAIDRYIAREAPLDCCGSYRIEGLGIALMDRIEGADFTAIVGLPLMAVAAMLRRAGFAIP